MEPLRIRYPKIEDEDADVLLKYLSFYGDCSCCYICDKLDLFHFDCKVCKYREESLRNVLILSFVPLVISLAKHNDKQHPDLLGVGLLTVTQLINRAPENINNVGGWIRNWLIFEMRSYKISNVQIHVKEHAGKKYEAISQLKRREETTVSVWGEQGYIDIVDVLSTIPKTLNEKIILNCIVKGGYSIKELMKLCSLKKTQVSAIQQDMLFKLLTALRGN